MCWLFPNSFNPRSCAAVQCTLRSVFVCLCFCFALSIVNIKLNIRLSKASCVWRPNKNIQVPVNDYYLFIWYLFENLSLGKKCLRIVSSLTRLSNMQAWLWHEIKQSCSSLMSLICSQLKVCLLELHIYQVFYRPFFNSSVFILVMFIEHILV